MKSFKTMVLTMALVTGLLISAGQGPAESAAAASLPKAPIGVVAKKASSTSIKLSWKKVSKVSGYAIYRQDSKGKKFKLVKLVKKGSTVKWTNKKLKKDRIYTYKVKSYIESKKKKKYGVASDWVSVAAYTSKAKKVNAKRVTVAPSTIKLEVGKTGAVKATPVPAVSKRVVINKTIRWSSSNKAIATVDSKGKVKAQKKTGKCVITAMAHNGYKAQTAVTVTRKADIKLAKPEITLKDDVISWNAVPKADGYKVKVDGRLIGTKNLEYNLLSLNLKEGTYEVEVWAVGPVGYQASDAAKISYKATVIKNISLDAGKHYNDPQIPYIFAVTDFELKDNITPTPYADYHTDPNNEAVKNAYKTVINATSDAAKAEAAKIIGTDIIVTLYYLDDDNQKQILNYRENKGVLSKNKYGDGWLHKFVGEGENYERIPGSLENNVLVPKNLPLQTSSAISVPAKGTGAASHEWAKIAGKDLYFQLDVIKMVDGKAQCYREVDKKAIEPIKLASPEEVKLTDDELSWKTVPGATAYKVKVDDQVFETEDLTYDLAALGLDQDTYEVEVWAVGADGYRDSESAKISYQVTSLIKNFSLDAGKHYNDPQIPYIFAVMDFELKDNITPTPYADYHTDPNNEAVKNAYKTVINATSDAAKAEAAKIIGTDIIVTLYYLDDDNQKQILNYRENKGVLSKNKYWDGWLHKFVGEGENYERIPGSLENNVLVPKNLPLQTSSAISVPAKGTGAASHEWAKIAGKDLYAQLDVIKVVNGKVQCYREVDKKAIESIKLASPEEVKLTADELSWKTVPGAAAYKVKVGDQVFETEDLTYDLAALGLDQGSYEVEVWAIGSDGYEDSNATKVTYEATLIKNLSLTGGPHYNVEGKSPYFMTMANFELKEEITPSSPESDLDQQAIADAYESFITTDNKSKKLEAARKIGTDVVITYYYFDDLDQKQVVKTQSGTALSKNKFWKNSLHQSLNGDGIYERIDCDPTYIGVKLPKNIPLQTSSIITVPAYGNATSHDLESIEGRELFVQLDVIKVVDDKVQCFTKTDKKAIDKLEE